MHNRFANLPPLVIAALLFAACSKESKTVTPPPPPVVVDTTVVIQPPVEPSTASTIGFFLDDWAPRTFTAPVNKADTVPGSAANTVTVDVSKIITKIPQSIFGQNAVWWMGPGVLEDPAITNLKNLKQHIIRFPGGSSSDAYFWNQPEGVLPDDAPATIFDKDGAAKEPGYRFGNTNFNWICSVDNYYTLRQQTGDEGIITVNYGYARYGTSSDPVAKAAHLAADWVRYDNGRTKYWEIGNENYGDWEWGYRIDPSKNKDGQAEYLTGALYAQQSKVIVDSMRKAATEIGKTIYIGSVTVEAEAEAWQTNTVKTWNSGMMPALNGKTDFYVVHNYITPYAQNSNADLILAAASTVPEKMMNFVKQSITTNGGDMKPIVLDEWNMFAQGSKQAVSNTSGPFAVLVLGEAIKNKYGMACRWDLMNGWDNGNDHGLFSAGDEPGINKWSPRPAFYYMYYFKQMLGDRLVTTSTTGTTIKAYGSSFTSGQAGVALVNTSGTSQTVEVKVANFIKGAHYYWYSLQGGADDAEFSRKVLVNGSGPAGDAGGPQDYTTISANSATTDAGIKVRVPARGSVFMVIDKK